MSKQRRAISLLELTIVILIIGVLAAIGSGRYSATLRRTKLVGAARQIAGHIDYIRSIAINSGRNTTLVCDDANDTYFCGDVDLPELPGQPLKVNVKLKHDPSFEIKADFDTQSSVSFDLEGTPHVGGVPLRNGHIAIGHELETLWIVVAAGTGSTKIMEPPAGGGTDEGGGGPIEVDGFTGATL